MCVRSDYFYIWRRLHTETRDYLRHAQFEEDIVKLIKIRSEKRPRRLKHAIRRRCFLCRAGLSGDCYLARSLACHVECLNDLLTHVDGKERYVCEEEKTTDTPAGRTAASEEVEKEKESNTKAGAGKSRKVSKEKVAKGVADSSRLAASGKSKTKTPARLRGGIERIPV